MLKVSTDKKEQKEIEFTGNGIQLNGQPVDWDLVRIGDRRFHVLKNSRSYTCEVVSADSNKKSFEIKVNGVLHTVEVQDQFDELLKKLGMDKAATHKVNVIKAPMPGLVLKIMIAENQDISEGDSVLILEAMKMENVIKSPGTGKVKTIRVKERDAVEKNEVLVELS
jgi:biotin carboxyl carrier protein